MTIIPRACRGQQLAKIMCVDHVGTCPPGFRATQIRELLDEALADDGVTFEELGAIHMDNHIGLARQCLTVTTQSRRWGH